MLLLIWLIVWLLSDTPPLEPWNAWLVSCIICTVLSLGGEAATYIWTRRDT